MPISRRGRHFAPRRRRSRGRHFAPRYGRRFLTPLLIIALFVVGAGWAATYSPWSPSVIVTTPAEPDDGNDLADDEGEAVDDEAGADDPDDPELAAPETVTAEAIAHDRVRVTWEEVEGADAYQVERDGHIVADDVRDTEWIDEDVEAEQGYEYRVRAFVAVDESEPEDTDGLEDVDEVVRGHQEGFTVPEDEIWEVEGEVTSSGNVVVLGGLKMRSGASLTFVDVDEGAFVGGGIDEVFDSDVGLWVMGSGVLDVQGSEKQGWNRTGEHASWDADDEYVRAPSGGEDGPQPWEFGDEVPCEEFAGGEYCAEVANLSRDVTIQGTEDGQSHIFIHSSSPQTIRFVELRFMGPNGDSDELLDGHSDPPVGRCCPDGRYGIHFHHSGDGSRGSVVEGVVARDSGDHVFAPHESHGITLRDNVAYNVLNTPYWWDPGDESHDIVYERNLALGVGSNRESTTSLAGFRMAKGQGVVAVGNVAAAVGGGRGSSGFLWNDGSPNKWVFRDNVAHHTNNGVWHWRNEGREPFEPHRQEGFVAYRVGSYAIEQGAYEGYSHWTDSVIFGQGSEGIRHRHAPNKYGLDSRGGTDEAAREATHPEHDDTSHEDLVPGSRYVGGTVQGGRDDGHGYAIAVEARRHCEGPADIGQHTLFEDLHLLPRDGYEAVKIDHNGSACERDDGRFHLIFRNVTVGHDQRPLADADIDIVAWPSPAVIEIEHDGDTTAVIEHRDR